MPELPFRKKAAGQLRLDNESAAKRGGISGAVINAGNAKSSLLLQRVLGEGGQARMPMGGDPLSAAQIELIRRWIDEGANWGTAALSQPDAGGRDNGTQQHWAYIPPRKAELPKVKNTAWVRNAIDHFILARLEKEGLTPSPEARKETLFRRLYLDLIGLPPSTKAVDAFLADQSEQAYEKVVDELLASKHFGERWARLWLDLARYADSNGYEKDSSRVMWKYRDWVIDAFNQNMPFDQFTIEQLAGDMLPKATISQRIATGFHRNTLLNQEGGVDDEEARFETLIDRVNTTSTVWMGSTLGCAQCHNHKYDPFSQKDYYRFMAFFDNHEYTISSTGNSEGWVIEPELELPTPEQEEKRKVIRAEIAALEAKVKAETPALTNAQTVWEREQIQIVRNWATLPIAEVSSSGGSTFTKLADQSVFVSGSSADIDEYVVTVAPTVKNITGIRIEVLPDAKLPQGGPGRDLYGNFVLTGVEVRTKTQPLKIATVRADNSAGSLNVEQFLNPPKIAMVNDNPGGWSIDATRDKGPRLPRQLVLQLAQPLAQTDSLTIKLKHFAGGLVQGLGRFRVSVTNAPDPLEVVRIPAAMRPILSLPVNARTEQQANDLKKLFRDSTPLLKTERERIASLKKELSNLKIATAQVMGERNSHEKPFTYFHERGAYLNQGEKMYAATPAALNPLPIQAPYNRLGLAYWLVDATNPLTARVTVNRFWETIFGRGLVLTSEDFGTQGEAPSHPELLDWLAIEFIGKQCAPQTPQCTSSGWNVKQLLKTIVMSATYRQSSKASPDLLEKDPYNRLLARGARFRMEAEMIRDSGLAISGLLSPKIGGPSVFPLQPEGIWANPYSSEKWNTSAGEDRYRRSLYTFVRRTSPHPAMVTLDAPNREICTVRRPRTNTPLQSLTLLNDEAALENARQLASAMILEGGSQIEAQLTLAFRRCTARFPTQTELTRLRTLYAEQTALYEKDEAATRKLVKASNNQATKTSLANVAARIIVANVLLNLDETLTKE